MNNEHIKQFKADAIAGGWNEASAWFDGVLIPQKMLLDPESWKAVSKTRRWEEPRDCIIDDEPGEVSYSWQGIAVEFFQDIMYGKTIDEALGEINN